MFADEQDAFSIVSESLDGTRVMNEATFSSASVLAERLERLKQGSVLFEEVSLSPYVEKLLSREAVPASG